MISCQYQIIIFYIAAALSCSSITLFSSEAFQLSTTSRIQGVRPNDVHEFLATPTNWPKIVLSSNSVQESSKANRIDIPLNIGDEVVEIFGLPPLLPLRVVWKCVESLSPPKDGEEGILEFYSSDGVPNLAKDCTMKFYIRGEKGCSVVRMDMEFDLISPLLLFGATPLLKLDNDIALKLLLPNAIKKK